MSVAPLVDPFRQLLNQISHDLTTSNLRSLRHICSPHLGGNRKENIQCGLDLFDCLIHSNIIGDELHQMCNLLYLMRQMKPLRKDIIKTVKKFIRENYESPWGFESSGESLQSMRRVPVHHIATHHHLPPTYEECGQSSTPTLFSDSDPSIPLVSGSNEQYSWCCICFECKCTPRPVPSCVLITCCLIFAALAVLVGFIWFVKVPKIWYDHLGDANKAELGAALVAVLTLLTVALLICYIYRKVCESRAWRPCHHQGLSVNRTMFSSVEYLDTLSGCSSYKPTPPVKPPKRRYKQRRRGSAQSAPVDRSSTSQIPYSLQSEPIPSRSEPTVVSSLPSYPDGCHDCTDEDGTSGNYASQSDFLTGEDSDGPTPVVVRSV